MNFKIIISSPELKKNVVFKLSNASVIICPKVNTKSFGAESIRIQCLTRADRMLEVRAHRYNHDLQREVSDSLGIETDPLGDSNHWLNRDPNKPYSKGPVDHDLGAARYRTTSPKESRIDPIKHLKRGYDGRSERKNKPSTS